MNKWIAEFDLEDGDTMPEHMDLNYMGAKIDFHCKPMWIPVSERLPEESIPVILTMEIPVFKDKPRREVVLASCHRFCKDKYKWLTYEDEPSIIDFPIAWMPLPEPYKAESEEEGQASKEELQWFDIA